MIYYFILNISFVCIFCLSKKSWRLLLVICNLCIMLVNVQYIIIYLIELRAQWKNNNCVCVSSIWFTVIYQNKNLYMPICIKMNCADTLLQLSIRNV